MVGREFPIFLRHKYGEIAVILCPYTQVRVTLDRRPRGHLWPCSVELPPIKDFLAAGWREISQGEAMAALERVADLRVAD